MLYKPERPELNKSRKRLEPFMFNKRGDLATTWIKTWYDYLFPYYDKKERRHAYIEDIHWEEYPRDYTWKDFIIVKSWHEVRYGIRIILQSNRTGKHYQMNQKNYMDMMMNQSSFLFPIPNAKDGMPKNEIRGTFKFQQRGGYFSIVRIGD
jgi:hypothetical protein